MTTHGSLPRDHAPDWMGQSTPGQPATEPRSRTHRLGATLAMTAAVFVSSGFLGLLMLWNGASSGDDPTPQGVAPMLAVPVALAGLVLVPALAFGRLPGRFTAISGWVWLAVAVALFAVPAAALGHVPLRELPNTTGDPTLPATISTYVVSDGVQVWAIVSAVLGGLVVAGAGFVIGWVARGDSARTAIVATLLAAIGGLLLIVGYALFDLGNSLSAHARYAGHAETLRGLPYLLWMAVPAVAVLAGAERAAADGAD